MSAPGRREIALLFGLLALAFALRLPELQEIPRLTDETSEVAAALEIAFEGQRPLVHNDAYRGPVWAYGLAGVLRIFGPRPGLPRFYALALGLASVLTTYALARALAGPRAARLAGLLQACAFAPIALESHVAWSNHATPAMVTLAALATARAFSERGVVGRDTASGAAPVRASSKRGGLGDKETEATATGDSVERDTSPATSTGWLLAAGLVWALALQTHPSAIAPLVGAAIWILACPPRRARLLRPAAGLALALFLLGLSPMIIHNLAAYGEPEDGVATSLDDATAESQPVNRDFSPPALARNLAALTGQLGRAAAAGRPVEPGEPVPGPLVAVTDALRPLAGLAVALLLLAALARDLLRGSSLPAALAWAGILILPLVNRNYQSFYDMRYLGFLLPLSFTALAVWLDGTRPRRRAWMIVALISAYSLLSVGAYYQREAAAGRTNAPLIAAVERLEQEDDVWTSDPADPEAPAEAQIWIDKAMRPIKLEGGGDPVRAFEHLLVLRGLPAQLSDVDELRWFLLEDERTRYWILAADGTADALAAEGFELETRMDAEGWQLLLRDPEAGPDADRSLEPGAPGGSEQGSQRAAAGEPILVLADPGATISWPR